MKKLACIALALAALTACNKSEVLEVAPQKAISFGAPFVENATKAIDPSLTDGTLTTFKVYGTLTNTSNAQTDIFNGVEVTKVQNETTDISGTNTWYYSGDAVQYWIPGNKYNFAALVNATSVTKQNNELPSSVSFINTDGTTDLLYAKSATDITTGDTGFNTNVAFTFDHLLSKVKFTFKNAYPANSNLVVKVSDIKITNAYGVGECTLASKEWTRTGTDVKEMSFGHIVTNGTSESETAAEVTADGLSSNYERLLIPGQESFNVTFSAQVTLNDVVVNSYSSAVISVTGGLQPGYSYNFVGTIGGKLNPITFSVEEVNGYTSAADQDITLQ